MNYEIISGALFGSLATIIIKAIISFINRKVEFNRDLKKHVFIRKLEIVEKAIEYYTSSYSNMLSYQKSFEVILNSTNSPKDLDLDVVNQIMKKNSEKFDAIEQKYTPEVYAIGLYIDIEDKELEEKKKEALYSIIEGFSELKALNDNITKRSHEAEQFIINKDEENAELALNEIESMMKEDQEKLQSIVEIIKEEINDIDRLVKEIKTEMKLSKYN